MDSNEQLKVKGNEFYQNDQYQEAIDCYKQAIKPLQHSSASELRASLYHNLSTAYYQTKQLHVALEYASLSLTDNAKLRRTEHEDLDKYLLMNIHIEQDQFPLVEQMLREVNIDDKTPPIQALYSDILAKLASAYINISEFGKAEKHARNALGFNEDLNRISHYYATLFLLTSALLGQGKIRESQLAMKHINLPCKTDQDKSFLDICNTSINQAMEKDKVTSEEVL